MGDIGRSDPADREPVTPVHIRHRIRRFDDAGQFGDVDHLLQSLVPGQVRDQRAGGEHHAGHPHPPVPRDDEPVGRLLNDLHRRCPFQHVLGANPRDRRPLPGDRLAQWMTWPMG